MKRMTQLMLALTITCSVSATNAYATSAVSTEELLSQASSLQEIAAAGYYVADDVLYATDSNMNQIYKYDGSRLTLLAGNANIIQGASVGGYIDGKAEYALFDEPFMAVPWDDGVIVSDSRNNMLRYVEDGIVTTYAGSQEGGYQDGPAGKSAFENPSGLALDESGNLYVADTGNGVIRKIDSNGLVSTYVEGLHGPKGLSWYDGSLYVTDIESNQVLSVTAGVATVVAGAATQIEDEWVGGYTDGSVADAEFSLPLGIYVDETGIYVGDTGNNVIRTIVDGQVYTSYSDVGIGEPSAVAIYDGELLVGDPFAKSTIQTGVTASDVAEKHAESTGASAEQSDSNTGDADDSDLVVQEVKNTTAGGAGTMGMLGIALVVVLGAVAIIVAVATKLGNKSEDKKEDKKKDKQAKDGKATRKGEK